MFNKISIFTLPAIIVGLMLVGPVQAQIDEERETSTETNRPEMASDLREAARETEDEFRTDTNDPDLIDPERLRETAEDTRDRFIEETDRVIEAMPIRREAPGHAVRQSARERAQALKQETRENWQVRKTESQERLNQLGEERRQAALERVSEVRRERVGQFAERMFTRMRASVERLAGLADRIETRLNHFADQGADMSDSRQALTAGRQMISEAEVMIAMAEDEVVNLLADENPLAVFPQVRQVVQNAAETIRQANRQLIEALVLMRPGIEAEPIDEEIDSEEEEEVNEETGQE